MMLEKKTVWVAYTNTDCTEGRGQDVPIAVCAAEATAIRLARKRYVQGSDGPVRPMELVDIEGCWYAPSSVIAVVEPTREDIAAQTAIDAKRASIAKAKAAGLTDADLQALGCEPVPVSRPEIAEARGANTAPAAPVDYLVTRAELERLLPAVLSDCKHAGDAQRRVRNNANIRRALYQHVIYALYSDERFKLEAPVGNGVGLFVHGYARDVWSYLESAYDLVHSIDFERDYADLILTVK